MIKISTVMTAIVGLCIAMGTILMPDQYIIYLGIVCIWFVGGVILTFFQDWAAKLLDE